MVKQLHRLGHLIRHARLRSYATFSRWRRLTTDRRDACPYNGGSKPPPYDTNLSAPLPIILPQQTGRRDVDPYDVSEPVRRFLRTVEQATALRVHNLTIIKKEEQRWLLLSKLLFNFCVTN